MKPYLKKMPNDPEQVTLVNDQRQLTLVTITEICVGQSPWATIRSNIHEQLTLLVNDQQGRLILVKSTEICY